MFSQHGHFTLAHSDRSLVVQTERAEVNRLLGIDSRVVDAAEVKKLCPEINISHEGVTWPILGALYHPPGGIIRHDAVVWGYAKQVCKAGIEIHQGTEVTGFIRDGNRILGVKTTAGRRHRGRRGQRHRRLVEHRRRHGRAAAADHDEHPAGVRDRAGEAVPRQDHRLGADAHLRLADRSRRVPHRRRGRAVPDLLEQGDVPVPRVRVTSRAGAVPAAPRDADPAPLDRSLRHEPRLQPDHRSHRARGLPRRLRLGHVRLQGGADRRRDACGADRDRARLLR